MDDGVAAAAAHRRQQSVRRGHAGLLGLVHMTGVEAHGMHAPSSEATGGSSLLSGQPRKQPHALVIMLQEIIQLALAQAAEES